MTQQSNNHDVNEHVRRYPNGRVVRVRPHRRKNRGPDKAVRLLAGQHVVLRPEYFENGGTVEAEPLHGGGRTIKLYKSTVMLVVRARCRPVLEEGGKPEPGMTLLSLATGDQFYLKRTMLEHLGLDAGAGTEPEPSAPSEPQVDMRAEERRLLAAERISRITSRPRGRAAYGDVTVNRKQVAEALRHFYAMAHLLDYTPAQFEERVLELLDMATQSP